MGGMRTKRRTLRAGLALAAALCALSSPGGAQSLGVSGGPAVPLGGVGEHRGVGVRGQLSAFSPGGLLRADLGAVLLPGSEAPGGNAWRTGDWRSVSVAGSALPLLFRSESLALRGLVGISAHRASIRGAENPYGTVPGIQLGTVWERPWGRHTLTAELGLHAVLSDYGVDELGISGTLPILVGVRW